MKPGRWRTEQPGVKAPFDVVHQPIALLGGVYRSTTARMDITGRLQ